MFENILVPVALNPGDDISRIIAAARLLKSEDGRLTMLHVLQEVPHYVVDQLPENALEESRERAKDGLETLARAAGPDIRSRIVDGHGARTIVATAKAMGADCVVMGSHAPGLGDYVIGSTSAYVERHASCSVLVVR